MKDVYLDKIKLASVIVEKELRIISLVNDLHRRIQEIPEIIKQLNENEDFLDCWRNLKELYDFLEFDYIKQLDKPKKEELENLIGKYNQFHKMKLEELNKAYNHIREVMSATKFHDLIRSTEEEDGSEDW